MRTVARRAVVIGMFLSTAAIAASGCRHRPAPSGESSIAQKTDSADSIEGIVRIVGLGAAPDVVLQTDDARSLSLAGPASLNRVSGLRVLVRGYRAARHIDVRSFRVVAANGILASDGTLTTDGAQLVLVTEGGRRVPVARPSAGLRTVIGHRVWISGPLEGETVAYGVIE